MRAARQQVEAELRDDAVLADERHDVGERADRGDLDEAGQPALAAGLRAERLHQLQRHADAGQVLVRIRAVVPLRVDDGERRRQLGVRLVVIGDDQVDAELARAARGVGAANAAVDRHDERDAVGVQPLDRRRLQAVAVAQPLRDEVDDVGAEQLERAAQDHRRRDAVDVVVAVDGDPLPARDRAPGSDRRPRACRRAASDRAGGRATGSESAPPAPGRSSPRWHSSRATTGVDAERRRQPRGGCVVAGLRCQIGATTGIRIGPSLACPKRSPRRTQDTNGDTDAAHTAESRPYPHAIGLGARVAHAVPQSTKSSTNRSQRVPCSGTSRSAGRAASRCRARSPPPAPARARRSTSGGGRRIGVGAADRLGHDLVDDAGLQQIGRRELQRRGRLDLLRGDRATEWPRSPRAESRCRSRTPASGRDRRPRCRARRRCRPRR